MAAIDTPDVPRQNNFFTLRDKFESLASSPAPDRRCTMVSSSYQSLTLGRKVARGSSFSFGSRSSSSSLSPSSPQVRPHLLPLVSREQKGRSSARSLQDSGYDSYTLASPPRRLKSNRHDTVDYGGISPIITRKIPNGLSDCNLAVKMTPAFSMTNLTNLSCPGSLNSSPSPLKGSSPASVSVFNLAIEPSQCVSSTLLCTLILILYLMYTNTNTVSYVH